MVSIRRLTGVPATPPAGGGPPPPPTEAGTGAVALVDDDRPGTLGGFDPPAPSDWYRGRPDYLTVTELADQHAVSMRAHGNYRRWQNRHAGAQAEICGWLADAGHLGPEAKEAHQRYVHQAALIRAVEANVAKVRLRHEEERAVLADALLKLTVGKDDLPSGGKIISAELELHAAEEVAEAVRRVTPTVNARWGRCVAAIRWRDVLARVEPLATPEAQRAASWIRAKLDDGPGPGVDPVRWA